MPLPSDHAQVLHWRAMRGIVLARDSNACRACGDSCSQGEADVHHLIPRAAGGVDDPANLITLCDGCHAAHHPNLQGTLARRMIERWGLRLARWLDSRHELADVDESLGAAMRLFGVSRLRTPQLEVILAALRKESLLLVSATGSGKSLCFQVPILLSRGYGLVISPLKALMSQQVAALQSKKVPGTFINGDLSPQEKTIRYQLLRDSAIKFLYCTPERFDPGMVREAEISEIARVRPSYLVIDEAHCIDRWGKDFRPNYGKLGAVRRALGNPPLLAFTATAGRESQQRILESLGIPEARVVVTGVNRPNIKLMRLNGVDDAARFLLIKNLLAIMPPGHAMLFVPTVKTGRKLQDGLQSLGMEVPFFHSKFGTANDRDNLLGRFTGRLDPPAKVIICTNAFGMGLDVPDVRLVVHWQHPASVEDYLQEFGRAGRDGNPSIAVLFTGENDGGLLSFMAEKTVNAAVVDVASKPGVLAEKLRAIEVMHKAATARDSCFRVAINEYFGEVLSPQRRSLAVQLVDLLFSRSVRTRRTPLCCDWCDGVKVDNVTDWVESVFAQRQ
ncbi:MAG: RecQ family ATP-dependent DNA helicase [Gemmatimonadales bacterium]